MGNRLDEKVALITGGGSGIGQAIATTFARQGAKVVVSGRTLATLEAMVNQITELGCEAVAVQGDVARADDVQRMVQACVNRFDRLNVLVNNAGVRASIGTILDLSEEEWQRTMATVTDGYRPAEISVSVSGIDADVETCRLRHGDGSYLIGVWLNQRAVDVSPVQSATIRIGGLKARSATGIDPINGLQQDFRISLDGSDTVISGCQIRDYPLLLKVNP